MRLLLLLLFVCYLGSCFSAELPARMVPDTVRDFALNHLELASNNYFSRQIKEVRDGSVGIIFYSGIVFNFTLSLGRTNCSKEHRNAEDKCVIQADTSELCRVSVLLKTDEPGTIVEGEHDRTLSMLDFDCSRDNYDNVEEEEGYYVGSMEEEEDDDEEGSVDEHGYVPGQVQIVKEENVFEHAVEELEETIVKDFTKVFGGGDDGEEEDETVEDDHHEIVKAKMKQLLAKEESNRQLGQLQSHSNFKRFVKRFNKDYSAPGEYWQRYLQFRENMKIVQFLRETEQGTARYGITKYADYTEEEKKQLLGLRPERRLLLDEALEEVEVDVEDPLPKEWDWREHGVVTPVKNQGQCGSCWAFSVTGNVEGQWMLKTGKLLSLSEQELVDCDRLDQGCNGGLPMNAYKSIIKLGGLETESDYEYDGVDEKCHFDKTKVRATIKRGVQLPKNETKLASWLVKNGPISIGINANAMMFYMGGVSHPWKFLCSGSPDSLDHGVLIVGYGTDEYPYFHTKLPFWNIKNSWGEDWGEQGYYRVYRGDGTCGVNQMATSSKV